MTDKNCLTYWFPRLLAAGVPVPRTEIVDAGENWQHLLGYFDDPNQHPVELANAKAVMLPLVDKIRFAAGNVIGRGPWFLRTGQGSGKHNWKECCDLRDLDAVENNILSLVQWSEVIDFMGLPWRYWAVRERLPVKPIAVLPGYDDMPLVREMRCFVEGGKILCHHPYWPRNAIRDGLSPAGRGLLFEYNDVASEIEADRLYAASLMDNEAEWDALSLAKKVANAFADDGCWSVDVLETEAGFYVTDMAIGERSFHWPECEKNKPK